MSLLLWLSPVLAPLAAAAFVIARPGQRSSLLLVLAPVPAAVLAAADPALPAPSLDWVLLGTEVALDGVGRVLLALTALSWIVAGVYARPDASQARGYAVWWLLSLAGNVGVVLAADVLSFYTAFVVLTLAAYGLVVHQRTVAARRAGRVTIVLGVAGETALLAGLLLAAVEAAGLRLDDLAAAVATSPRREVIVALLVVGFGIKAGLIGLHMWLPLAHPAAPFAASAVLSGAMIKAGLVGWLRLLPIGELALPGWALLLVVLGLAGALLGVAIGLTQRAPKVLLAYSSVSQMGLITVLVGAALASPAGADVASAAAAAYALHHGLAKALLFLGVGLLAALPGLAARRVVEAGMVVAGLSLAGAPLTSGAFAKAWMKQSLEISALGGWPLTLSTLAAAGTTALMIRLLLVLRAQPLPAAAHRAATPRALRSSRLVLTPWVVLAVGVTGLTPLLVPRLLPVLAPPSLTSVVGDPLPPVLLGVVLAILGVLLTRVSRLSVPAVPAGDLVVVAEHAASGLAATWRRTAAWSTAVLTRAHDAVWQAVRDLGRQNEGLDRIEERLTRWSTGGAMVGVVAVALLVAVFRTPT